MRTDIHAGPEHRLYIEAEYIDAALTFVSPPTSSCDARPDHTFGTIKLRMGATHFLMKTLPKVTCEMALHVLAYNLTRVLNILSIQPLMAALRA
jgi:hypothetical protein